MPIRGTTAMNQSVPMGVTYGTACLGTEGLGPTESLPQSMIRSYTINIQMSGQTPRIPTFMSKTYPR